MVCAPKLIHVLTKSSLRICTLRYASQRNDMMCPLYMLQTILLGSRTLLNLMILMDRQISRCDEYAPKPCECCVLIRHWKQVGEQDRPANREVHGIAGHNGEGGYCMGGPCLSKSFPAKLMHNGTADLLAGLHTTDTQRSTARTQQVEGCMNSGHEGACNFYERQWHHETGRDPFLVMAADCDTMCVLAIGKTTDMVSWSKPIAALLQSHANTLCYRPAASCLHASWTAFC